MLIAYPLLDAAVSFSLYFELNLFPQFYSRVDYLRNVHPPHLYKLLSHSYGLYQDNLQSNATIFAAHLTQH